MQEAGAGLLTEADTGTCSFVGVAPLDCRQVRVTADSPSSKASPGPRPGVDLQLTVSFLTLGGRTIALFGRR